MAKKVNEEYVLNRVEGFNPYAYVEEARDRNGEVIMKKDGNPLMYMSTTAKLTWFRMMYPMGIVKVTCVESNIDAFPGVVRYCAEVKASSDMEPIAVWSHQESVWDVSEYDAADSRAQTVAIGKALSKAGFGCEIEMKLGMDENPALASKAATDTSKESPSEEETGKSDEPKVSEEKPAPKKRGRKKKSEVKLEQVTMNEVADTPVTTENKDDDILSSIENMLDAAEKAAETGDHPETEPSKTEDTPSEKGKMTLEEALKTAIIPTEKANITITRLQGTTLEDAMKQTPSICKLLLERENLKESVTEEVLAAAKVIMENN